MAKGKLNPENVPERLRHLIPLAEKWGIGDDIYREEAVDAANRQDIEELVEAFEATGNDAFDDWLAGPEAAGPTFSPEYIAFSDLREAYDSAEYRYHNSDE
jgi:hypothetical protein